MAKMEIPVNPIDGAVVLPIEELRIGEVMPDDKLTRLMLCAVVAVPLLYFGVQLIAAPCYPGYSFATDTASMLGTAASRHPGIFNDGAILVGIAGLFGAAGLFLGLSSAIPKA